ncbi:glycosyltransferase [Haloferax prahovense]|nr:glycosyltransferase [Haloferax prahovense]
MNNEPRVLVLHDFFFSIGGAEWDAIKTSRHFDAPIATFDPPDSSEFSDIEFISLGSVENYPFGARESKIWFKNLLRAYTGQFDEYDVIIINKDWSKSIARAADTPTIYYCHSPERHLYDANEFRYNWLKQRSLPKAAAFKIFTSMMRPLDQGDIDQIDTITCNSKNIQQRCLKYYGIQPEVIYPPVETSQFHFEEVGDFWLNVSRLGPGKRIEFLIDTFNKTGENIKIVGSPDREEYYEKYKQMANENVELLRSVQWDELKNLYSMCKGLVTVAKDEDFGLTPVEAMASGKPVIAVNEGGYKETVVDTKTGWLLPLDKDEFRHKIESASKQELRDMREECFEQAKKFDEEHFYNQMENKVEELSDQSDR